MELEKKKKERKILRTVFTKNANEFETLKKDSEATSGKYKMIEGIYTNIQTLDKEICQLMLDVDCAEDILEKEINDAMKYKENWLQLQIKFNSPVEMKSHIQNDGRMQRNFKLPAIELKKFDGDIKNWLSFWGQFQKIDADPNLDETDKFQYLIQSMTPDTEVKSFVNSFPPSDQCYALCITELKSRYARDELLIQVYVRELLALILHKEKVGNMELTTLYDKLNAHLRSLEILGVTKDKYSAFLLPMVESALPLDILRTWERAKPLKMEDELSSLLSFLKREVESEQRITMAKNSFGLREMKSTLPFDTNDSGNREPTAGCLLTNVRDKPRCVWCDRETHSSLECFKVQKMSSMPELTLVDGKSARKPRGGRTVRFCGDDNEAFEPDDPVRKEKARDDDASSYCSTCSSSSSSAESYTLPTRRAYGGVRISYVPNDAVACAKRERQRKNAQADKNCIIS